MTNLEIRIKGVPQEDPNDEKDAAADDQVDTTANEEKSVEDKVIDALREVYDPEIPVNIYDLGLVYEVNIDDDNKVTVKMTLTSPACPVAESLPLEVRTRVSKLPEVSECEIDLVWEPPWDPDRMSEDAKLTMGML